MKTVEGEGGQHTQRRNAVILPAGRKGVASYEDIAISSKGNTSTADGHTRPNQGGRTHTRHDLGTRERLSVGSH